MLHDIRRVACYARDFEDCFLEQLDISAASVDLAVLCNQTVFFRMFSGAAVGVRCGPDAAMRLIAGGEREVPSSVHPHNGFHAAEQADVHEMEEGLRELEQDYK